MFAVKEFREMNDGKVEVNNLQLIKQSKISHSNITMHRAIFTYLDTYHILYDVADANLKEFLEANNFDQYSPSAISRAHVHDSTLPSFRRSPLSTRGSERKPRKVHMLSYGPETREYLSVHD